MVFSMNEIKEKYLLNSEIHGNIDLDSKTANKAARELLKLNEYMIKKTDIAKEVIDILLYSNNANAQVWIAGLAIDLHYKEKEAIELLTSLGKNQDIGVLAMNARLRLADRKIIPIDKW